MQAANDTDTERQEYAAERMHPVAGNDRNVSGATDNEESGKPIRRKLSSGRIVFVNPAEVSARKAVRKDSSRRNAGQDTETNDKPAVEERTERNNNFDDNYSGRYETAAKEREDAEPVEEFRNRNDDNSVSPAIPRRTVHFERKDVKQAEQTENAVTERPAGKITKVFTTRRALSGNRDGERRDLHEFRESREEYAESGKAGRSRESGDRFERRDSRDNRDSGDNRDSKGNFRDNRGRRDDRNRDGDRERKSRDGDRRNDRDGERRNDRGPRRDKKEAAPAIVYEETDEFVIPGCVIGALEEFAPGYGCVANKGNIVSVISGRVGISKADRIITVLPVTSVPNMICDGDIVIGVVTDVRESNVRIDIVATEKAPDREIVNNGNAEIYVSNVKDAFTRSIAEEFAPRDIIRARVINSSKIGLSTVSDDLGVIKAYCSKCKAALELNGPVRPTGSVLKCPECGNTETRKAADTYGQGVRF